MNEPTEQELKIGLSRLIPDLIDIQSDADGDYVFRWLPVGNPNDWLSKSVIKDTEWLHVVHLIEETFTVEEAKEYCREIEALPYTDFERSLGVCRSIDWRFAHSIWQTKAKAILKIKGKE